MKVTVVLLGWLESPLGTRRLELELPKGARVRNALTSLKMEEVEYSTAILNSQQAYEDEVLKDGDTLYVFPPIAGG